MREREHVCRCRPHERRTVRSRVLVRRPFRTRERITEWAPGERFGYEVIGGLRVRGYRATVTLEDARDGGTLIRWRSTYDHAGPTHRDDAPPRDTRRLQAAGQGRIGSQETRVALAQVTYRRGADDRRLHFIRARS
ncbi:MAG: SRPBCC family protein [Gaiellaceae bacterium]